MSNEARLIIPKTSGEYLFLTLDQIVERYLEWLDLKHRVSAALFRQRLQENPDGARAEAAMFSFLRTQGLNPRLLEDPSGGGPDFECRPRDDGAAFCVEVTTLNTDAVSRDSSLPSDETFAGSFSMITQRLCDTAKSKVGQLAKYPGARVLVIALAHGNGSLLTSGIAAKWLLTSETTIMVPLDHPGNPNRDQPIHEATDLKHSVFVRRDKDDPRKIVSCRESISAILFANIYEKHFHLRGLLHQEPRHPFDIWNLPKVPFAKLRWPVRENRLDAEWIMADPDAFGGYHHGFTLSQKELTTDEAD